LIAASALRDGRGYGGSSESPRDWQAHREDAIALIDALDAAARFRLAR